MTRRDQVSLGRQRGEEARGGVMPRLRGVMEKRSSVLAKRSGREVWQCVCAVFVLATQPQEQHQL